MANPYAEKHLFQPNQNPYAEKHLFHVPIRKKLEQELNYENPMLREILGLVCSMFQLGHIGTS